jgi:SAM-dependent methyltransferase
LHYVAQADRYDLQLAPFAAAMLDRAELESTHGVLDVGCGCGATALAAAETARDVVGLDISKPLLAVAVERAKLAGVTNVSYVLADAQTHEFAEGTHDVIMSQFGLMFFDDPERAFANLHRSLIGGGRIVFVSWQGIEANEWVSIVADEVARHTELPDLGGRSGGPGMFALKHRREIVGLLDAVGFTEISVEPIDPPIVIGGGGTLDETLEFFGALGIVRGLLGRLDDEPRAVATAEVLAQVAQRFEPGEGARFGTGGWLTTARRHA